MFLAIATFFWLSYFPVAIVSVWKILKNRKMFVEQDLRRLFNDPAIIFQITTRSATNTSVVKRGIQSIIRSAHKVNFYNYQISVVTDDPEDERTLKGMKCEVVVVDPTFQTNAIRKGRALQYAVEHLRNPYDANIFAPESTTLVYSDALLGVAIPTLPLRWLGMSPIGVLNVVVILAFAASAAAAYLFVRLVTGGANAALLYLGKRLAGGRVLPHT